MGSCRVRRRYRVATHWGNPRSTIRLEWGTLQPRQDLLTLTAAIESDAVAIDRWRTIDHETSRARDLRKLVARRSSAGVYPGHPDEQSRSVCRYGCDCRSGFAKHGHSPLGPDLHGRQGRAVDRCRPEPGRQRDGEHLRSPATRAQRWGQIRKRTRLKYSHAHISYAA